MGKIGGAGLITVGLLAAAVLTGQLSHAAQTLQVRFTTPQDAGSENVLAFEGRTFSDVKTQLEGADPDGTVTIPLSVAGFQSFPAAGVSMTVESDDATRSIVLHHDEGTEGLLGEHEARQGAIKLLLTARWETESSTTPQIALGIKTTAKALTEIHGAWGEVEGAVPNVTTPIFALAASEQHIDPAQFPGTAVETFYLSPKEPLSLTEGTNLHGAIPYSSHDAMKEAARFMTRLVPISASTTGPLDPSASIVFDPDNWTDASAFALRAVVTTNGLPSWITKRDAAFLLGFDTETPPQPRIDVDERIEVTADETTNVFAQTVSLADAPTEAATIPVTGAFDAPFGLGWMGMADDDTGLRLRRDENAFRGGIAGRVEIGEARPLLTIGLEADGDDARPGDVRIDGEVGLPDLMGWLIDTGSPFEIDEPIDGEVLDDVVLNNLWFRFAKGTPRTFMLFAETRLGALDMDTLVWATDSPERAALVAFRLAETCECFRLADVLPFAGSPVEDLQIRGAALSVVQPAAVAIDTGLLSPEAKEFLQHVYQQDLPKSFKVKPGLNMSMRLGLDPLGDVLEMLGVTGDDPEVLLRGKVGLNLNEFGTSDTPVASFKDIELSVALPEITQPQPLLDWLEMDRDEGGISRWTMGIKYVAPAGDPPMDKLELFARNVFTMSLDGFVPPPFTVEATFSSSPTDASKFELIVKAEIGCNNKEAKTAACPDDVLRAKWESPFGIDWLELDKIGLRVTFKSGADPEALLYSDFLVAGKKMRIELEVKGTSPVEATFQLKLQTPITLEDLLGWIFNDTFGIPQQILGSSFGPANLKLTVKGAEFEWSLLTTTDVCFQLPEVPVLAPEGSFPVTGSILFSASGKGAALDDFAFGLKPKGSLMLSHLLPGLYGRTVGDMACPGEAPSTGTSGMVDFALSSDDDKTGFGIMFTNGEEWSIPSGSLLDEDNDSLKAWLEPLFGPIPVDFTISKGFTVGGQFALPEGIGELVQGMGFLENVQATGKLPIPLPDEDLKFEFGLGLRFDPLNLPAWMKEAGLKISLGAEIKTPPALNIGMEGDMTVLVKQGLDVPENFREFVEPLEAFGVHLSRPLTDVPDAEDDDGRPIWPADTCPGSGSPEPMREGEKGEETTVWYCFDLIKLTVMGKLTVDLPKVEVTLLADAQIVRPPDAPPGVWHPFGIDWIGIGQMTVKVGIEYSPATAPPPGVSIKIGVAVNDLRVGPSDNAKSFSAALQIGIQPLANPPYVLFSFDGIRLSSSTGLQAYDLVDFYNWLLEEGWKARKAIADATGQASPPPPPLLDKEKMQEAVPDFGLRNLAFSLKPTPGTINELCIPFGLKIQADLYIDPPSEGLPVGEPLCNIHTGELDAPPKPPDPPQAGDDNGEEEQELEPDETLRCAANRDKGCFAGVTLDLSDKGIIAQAEVAPFNMGTDGPFVFEESILDLVLTIPKQHLKISGGVSVRDPGQPGQPKPPLLQRDELASGALRLKVKPTDFLFYGHLKIDMGQESFDALVDGEASLGLLNLQAPAFSLNVRLAADGPDGTPLQIPGPAKFLDVVGADAGPMLNDLEGALRAVDTFLADLGDEPLEVLRNLHVRLRGVGVPSDAPGMGPDGAIKRLQDGIRTLTDETGPQATRMELVQFIDEWLKNGTFPGIPGEVLWFPHRPSDGAKCYADFWYNPLWPHLPNHAKVGTVKNETCWKIEGKEKGTWVGGGHSKQPVCTGVLHASECWVVPPFNTVPGCNLLAAPESQANTDCRDGGLQWVSDTHVYPLFTHALAAVLTPLSNMSQGALELIEGLNSVLSADGALLGLRCAEFFMQIEGIQGSVNFSLDADVLLEQIQLEFGWDTGLTVKDNVGKLLADLLRQLFPPDDEEENGEAPTCSGVPTEILEEEGPDFALEITPELIPFARVTPGYILEGNEVTLEAGFNRELTAPRTLSIDWGDGTDPQTVTVEALQRSVEVAHTYVDDAPPKGKTHARMIVTVTDVQDSIQATDGLWVQNVRPTLDECAVVVEGDGSGTDCTQPGSLQIREGDHVFIEGTFTDPGLEDKHWVAVRNRPLAEPGQPPILYPDHAMTDESFTIHPLPKGAREFKVARPEAYGKQGLLGLQVCVLDDDMVVDAEEFETFPCPDSRFSQYYPELQRNESDTFVAVTVDNVAPSELAITPQNVWEGSIETICVRFEDPGFLNIHTLEVDWSNNGNFDDNLDLPPGLRDFGCVVQSFPDVPEPGAGSAPVDVRVRVTDDEGASTTRVIPVTVHNVAPVVYLDVTPEVDDGEEVCADIVFVDPGLEDAHEVTIDWGDPAVPTTHQTLAVGERRFSACTTYQGSGTRQITATVTDDNGGAGSEGTEVEVRRVPKPPMAVDDQIEAQAGQSLQFASSALTSNDHDPNGDSLTVESVSSPSTKGGTVALSEPGGQIVYTPPAGFGRVDTFAYTVSNPDGLTDTATVTVKVRPQFVGPCDTYFGGAGDGATWHDPANWEDGELPSDGDRACVGPEAGAPAVVFDGPFVSLDRFEFHHPWILDGGGVAVSSPSIVAASFTQSGGTLSGTGNVTLTAAGQHTWTGGSQQGTGTTIVANNSVLVLDAPDCTLGSGRTLRNEGTLVWNSPLRDLSARCTLAGEAVIDNRGLWTFNGGGVIAGSGTVANHGTIQGFFHDSAGPAVLTVEAFFEHTGALVVNAGRLRLTRQPQNFGASWLTGGTYTLVESFSPIPAVLEVPHADVRLNDAVVVLRGQRANIVDGEGRDAFRNLEHIGPNGDLHIDHGRDLETLGKLTNNGVVRIGGDSGAKTTLTVNGIYEKPGSTIVGKTGQLVVNDSLTVPAPGNLDGSGTIIGDTLVESGATLSGIGTFQGNVKTFGTTSPGTFQGTVMTFGTTSSGGSPGILSITDGFEQEEPGVLVAELGGTEPGTGYDRLVVGGEARLGGTLEVELIDDFLPAYGDRFEILHFGSRVGDFETVEGLDDPAWEMVYEETALVLLYVDPNRPPVALDIEAHTPEYEPITIDLLAYASDPDDDSLTVVAVGQPEHGTVTLHEDGRTTYTPDPAFRGEDAFTYTVSDAKLTDEATVHVTVAGCNSGLEKDGPASGTVADLERPAAGIDPGAAKALHDVNCGVIRPLEP